MAKITVKFHKDPKYYPDICGAIDSSVLVTYNYVDGDCISFETCGVSLEKLEIILESLSLLFGEPFDILKKEV